MSRWFMLVVFICVAGAYVAILRTPVVELIRESITARTEEAQFEVGAPAGEPERTTMRSGNSGSPPESLATGDRDSDASRPATALESPVLYVLNDSVTVYTSNSEDGNVLRILREGDQVERGVELLSPEGIWTQVRFDQQAAGFVRNESLSLR